ncbi:MAG: Rho termination factor N-terminal domain-containing protein [Desulfobulbaceae bacterium]|nr:Rho termination factor N-terminal domain-containing protein [Desulfobulbaceae bacterium]HIJ78010.1 transcription termination factor Rho [Deltaproteobacteria bacterium]
METQDKPMDKMTVKELREIAKELPGVTGVHSMKKDELLAAIAGAAGAGSPSESSPKKAAAPKAKAKKTAGPGLKSLSGKEIKDKISQLREAKATTEAIDKKTASIMRRKINRLKKHTRKKTAPNA